VGSEALPDFDRMAVVFDRYLPLIDPVGEAVLDHLAPVPDGAQVLDVACGTGEPGLTLARRSPGVHIVGIDAADGMVQLARAKAHRDGVRNIRFEAMAAERMTFADQSMDAVISRFGLLMFGDTAAGARQLARVLRPGGSFSIAVWDDMSTNILVRLTIDALRPRVPPDLVAPFERLDGADARDRLRDAAVTNVQSAVFEWHYALPPKRASGSSSLAPASSAGSSPYSTTRRSAQAALTSNARSRDIAPRAATASPIRAACTAAVADAAAIVVPRVGHSGDGWRWRRRRNFPFTRSRAVYPVRRHARVSVDDAPREGPGSGVMSPGPRQAAS
jgi:SAM-dependent methyltransferase